MELKVQFNSSQSMDFDWKLRSTGQIIHGIEVEPNEEKTFISNIYSMELDVPPVYTYIVSTTTDELLYTAEGKLYEDDVVTKYSIKKGTFRLSYNRECEYEIQFEPTIERLRNFNVTINKDQKPITITVKNITDTTKIIKASVVIANIKIVSVPQPKITVSRIS